MMQIHVRLHGALRDKLALEAKGRTILTMPDGAPVTAVLEQLSLHRRINVAVNDEIIDDWNTSLHDGDRIEIFRPTAGGSAVKDTYCAYGGRNGGTGTMPLEKLTELRFDWLINRVKD